MADSKTYSRLPSSEDGDGELQSQPPPVSHRQRAIRYVIIVFLVASTLALGYAVGYHFGSGTGPASDGNPFAAVGDVHYYMKFNGSFAQRSNAISDGLWDSLFPEKKGFIQHPEFAPDVAGIAVFHELHCLDILRSAFFASVDGKLEEMGAQSQEMNHRTSLHHIRHCFEYLRQSLICLADSNLEAMNYTTQGVSGWQTERTCRDYDGLVAWANEWGIAREDALRNHNWDNSTHPL
ncbi:hypothetical protein UA08_01852 [Talaromyces atroroseus]|uniref:Oxidase ustYa n=1 Tax=Talaromyces atroroseus TaxID=1441469 RepID=A0A1Q5QAR1_TALAT|nr:hypothetical protein UA08_01852 [Talaromyces atroroseus]OKL62898.1 hypothetical protein UA08_01852 [Talaromyces atroroseus]